MPPPAGAEQRCASNVGRECAWLVAIGKYTRLPLLSERRALHGWGADRCCAELWWRTVEPRVLVGELALAQRRRAAALACVRARLGQRPVVASESLAVLTVAATEQALQPAQHAGGRGGAEVALAIVLDLAGREVGSHGAEAVLRRSMALLGRGRRVLLRVIMTAGICAESEARKFATRATTPVRSEARKFATP